MPRPPRIEYPGAIYHLISCGDRREPIFRDDQDRRAFLRTLDDEGKGLSIVTTPLQVDRGPAPNGQLEPRLQPPVRRKEGGVQKVRPLYFRAYANASALACRSRNEVLRGRWHGAPKQ